MDLENILKQRDASRRVKEAFTGDLGFVGLGK